MASEQKKLNLDSKIGQTQFLWKQALTQGKTGVVAEPTPEQISNIEKQAAALQPLFDLIGGFQVTSWLRTPEHNKAIGGAPKSMHLTGLATDIIPTHMSVEEARKAIKDSKLYPGRNELGTTTWLHYDLKNNKDFKP